jgi:hypothetical protein
MPEVEQRGGVPRQWRSRRRSDICVAWSNKQGIDMWGRSNLKIKKKSNSNQTGCVSLKRWPFRTQKFLNEICVCRNLNTEQLSLLRLSRIEI